MVLIIAELWNLAACLSATEILETITLVTGFVGLVYLSPTHRARSVQLEHMNMKGYVLTVLLANSRVLKHLKAVNRVKKENTLMYRGLRPFLFAKRVRQGRTRT